MADRVEHSWKPHNKARKSTARAPPQRPHNPETEIKREAPCTHNEWLCMDRRPTYVRLKCMVCAKKWRTVLTWFGKCPEFHSEARVCSAGTACSYPHIYARSRRHEAPSQRALLAEQEVARASTPSSEATESTDGSPRRVCGCDEDGGGLRNPEEQTIEALSAFALLWESGRAARLRGASRGSASSAASSDGLSRSLPEEDEADDDTVDLSTAEMQALSTFALSTEA